MSASDDLAYDPFVESIRQGLRIEIKRIANEETEAALKRTIDRISEKLDLFTLQMLSRYTIERNQHEVVIRVDKRALAPTTPEPDQLSRASA